MIQFYQKMSDMEQVKDNGKTEQKWPREPILGILGTNAISHITGGGRHPAWGPKIPSWFSYPTARPLTDRGDSS